MKKSYLQSGQSLIEVLIAISIVVIGMSGVISLIYGQQYLVADKEDASASQSLASEGIDAAKSIARTNWVTFVPGTYGLSFVGTAWQFSGTQDQSGSFTRKIIVETVDQWTKKITAQITWTSTLNRPQTTQISTLISNWNSVLTNGGGPGSNDTGLTPGMEWERFTNWGGANLVAGRQGTDIAVKNKIVYISTISATATHKDLSIYNATNPAAVTLMGEVDTGGGINEIALNGNYIYAVSSDATQEFLIIDVTNPAAPVKVSGLDLPGTAAGLSVFYSNGYAYVGRATGAAQEFVVIDVANPLAPTIAGGLTGVGGVVNSVFVSGNVAYLGTGDATKGLITIDITSPATPAVLGTLNVGEAIYSIFVQNSARVFIGGNNFYAIDASYPNNISKRSSISAGARINDIVAVGNYAFLATSNSTRDFTSILLTDPKNLKIDGSINFTFVGSGITYENNFVYISLLGNDALRIITAI